MTHHDSTHESSRQELERLEQELAARRERVSQLVGAIEKKVSAGQVLGQGGDLVKQFGRTAKEHPVPSLVAAAGLAWLYAVKDQHPGDHEAGNGMLHTLKDKTHGAGEAIRGKTHAGMEGARHLLEENPSAAGAIAVAAGALLGALIPPTRKEDELWGETRDRLAERARELSARAAEQARQAERQGPSQQGPSQQGQPPYQAYDGAGDSALPPGLSASRGYSPPLQGSPTGLPPGPLPH